MPKIKWTYEACLEEALKYTMYSDFRKKSNSCYCKVQKSGWEDSICNHLIKERLPPNYWTKEKCIEEVSKYNTLKDFMEKSNYCYSTSKNKGWLPEIAKHLLRAKPIRGFWTKERCLEKALLCKYKKEFKELYPTASNVAYKNGWFDEICQHMVSPPSYNLMWTFETCKEEASKYNTKRDFYNSAWGCYQIANKNKWVDEICSHMEILGNLHNRFIYAYEFPDNSVYVGLTFDINMRKNSHCYKGSVFDYINESGLTPVHIQLTNIPVCIEEAQRLEGYYVKEYYEKGWKILNRAKTGGLGGNIIKWNYENCKKEALKYSNKTSFRNNSSGAYYSSVKNKWIDDVCSHMIIDKSYKGKYTLDKCLELVKSCSTIKEFASKYNPYYRVICKNNWREIVLKDLKPVVRESKYPLERLIEIAKICSSKRQMCLEYEYAYNRAYRMGWMQLLEPYFNFGK